PAVHKGLQRKADNHGGGGDAGWDPPLTNIDDRSHHCHCGCERWNELRQVHIIVRSLFGLGGCSQNLFKKAGYCSPPYTRKALRTCYCSEQNGQNNQGVFDQLLSRLITKQTTDEAS